METVWLGQAGLYMKCSNATIILDPYFSDSVKEHSDPSKKRRVPIDEHFLSVEPDFLMFTHNHLDHFDPQTASIYLSREKKMTVLAPSSVLPKARSFGGRHHNYVQMNRHTVWTEKGIRFESVKAEHSDEFAVGFIIEELSTGDKYYITGDTLYNREILHDIPPDIHAIFLPINGAGNNMNMTDAAVLAKESGAKLAVPVHFGMFDSLDPHEFPFENKVIPELYKKIELNR